MRAPAFWQSGGMPAALLSPFSPVYAAATAMRVSRPGWRAPVPVLCCGNATAGGAGKTTLALDIGARLAARGTEVAYLTRGYGGRAAAPVRVDPGRHVAAEVGDEPLLLAAVAPTWVCADRAEGARAAVAAGARALVMDDGLQHPSLAKDLSLLVIDGAAGFGNGRVIPAGPLREPVAAAAARCRAAVLIGDDATGALRALPSALPVVRAALRPDGGIAVLAGRRAFAFAGIGRPAKFFAMLAAAGIALAGQEGFADHHRYTQAELDRLLATAARLDARAVTTPKDAARLTPAQRRHVIVVGVRLVWRDEVALADLLAELA
jgi:tetraacyldisaccharide 4'-kinase